MPLNKNKIRHFIGSPHFSDNRHGQFVKYGSAMEDTAALYGSIMVNLFQYVLRNCDYLSGEMDHSSSIGGQRDILLP